jgi:hypothetical protein
MVNVTNRKVYKWEIAWYLYCRATRNSSCARDFWEELSEDTQRRYLVAETLLTRHQRLYYSRRVKSICIQCRKPVTSTVARCQECSMKETRRMREKYGHKEWRPGSRGKQPKYVEAT